MPVFTYQASAFKMGQDVLFCFKHHTYIYGYIYNYTFSFGLKTSLFLKNEKTNTVSLGNLRCFKHQQNNHYLIEIRTVSINYEIFVPLENFV